MRKSTRKYLVSKLNAKKVKLKYLTEDVIFKTKEVMDLELEIADLENKL